MKKTILLFFMLVVLSVQVFASEDYNRWDRKTLCELKCGEDTVKVSKWHVNSNGLQEKYNLPGYDIHAELDNNYIHWDSNRDVACAVTKEANNYYVSDGGTEGKIELQFHRGSKVTFCGYDNEEVPEFSTLGFAGILIGSLATIFMLRRK